MSEIVTAPVAVESHALAERDDVGTAIARLVSDPAALNAIDPARLSDLLNIAERLRDERARIAFCEALCAAQSEMHAVGKRGVNEHTRSKYALLEDILREAMPVLARHGFSVSFSMEASSVQPS